MPVIIIIIVVVALGFAFAFAACIEVKIERFDQIQRVSWWLIDVLGNNNNIKGINKKNNNNNKWKRLSIISSSSRKLSIDLTFCLNQSLIDEAAKSEWKSL